DGFDLRRDGRAGVVVEVDPCHGREPSFLRDDHTLKDTSLIDPYRYHAWHPMSVLARWRYDRFIGFLAASANTARRRLMTDQHQRAERQLRVAVVGGGIGKQHLTAYRQLADLYEVVAFCDTVPERARAIADEFCIGRTAATLDDLLKSEKIDIVDLCTPPNLHVPQIKQVLAAGKHVICEKPIAGTLKELDELAEAERTSGKTISPIFQYRFGDGFRKLMHLKVKGLLGHAYLATVETHWKRDATYYAHPWRGRLETELGGCLVSHAIHAHDLLLTAFGPAKSIHGRTATRVNQIEVEDCAVLSLEMAGGALAALTVTLGAEREHTRLRFMFEHATVTSSLGPYNPGADPWIFEPRSEEARGLIEAVLAEVKPGRSGFAGQFSALHEVLTTGTELPVTLADARRSIELFTAAYHAATTDDTVELPLSAVHEAYEYGAMASGH
ncbi:MAG: Gfo/Idh/MocA family protein, partial [Geminicoccaceae bacterium]